MEKHQNINESTNVSRCMYCGSTSYGSGCIFSSHKTHIHVDDPTRCIYCGLLAYGSGCVFNPYGKVHIHGMDVAQGIKESTRKTVELTYITDRLFEPIYKNEAYKLGLIDNKGNIKRVPNSFYEQYLISPLSKILIQIKNYININRDIIIESLKLLSSSKIEESADLYTIKLNAKEQLKPAIEQLKQTISQNSTLMPLEDLEQIIEEVILETVSNR